MLRFRPSLLAVLAAIGVCAPPASASTVTLSGGVMTYSAALGEDNNLSVFHPISGGVPDTSLVVIDEDGLAVTVGAAPATCTKPNTTQVSCPAASVTSVTLNLSDLDDTARGGDGDTAVNADFNKPITFNGGSGGDGLTGEDGADSFIGSSGNDILEGQAGADTYDCSTDFDTVSYDDDRGSGIFLDLDNDGYPDNDTFVSESACEKWSGTDFNDTFLGNTGANTFDGLVGVDVVRYDDGRTTPVVANLTTGVGADGDTLIAIENLRGSVDNDVLTGDANANQLDGLEGNDTLIGAANVDALNGGDGNNTASYEERLTAVTADLEGAKPDGDTYSLISSLRGGSGADTLFGSAAQNTLDGGGGNDVLVGRGLDDTLVGGAGTADLASYEDRGGNVVASLFTNQNPDNDTYSGIEGLRGGTGADTLAGGNGPDTLQGGGNDDILIGGTGIDLIDGGAGTNTASYQDSVASGAGGRANGAGIALDLATAINTDGDLFTNVQRFTGTDFVDTMTGGPGADFLSGDDGNDVLSGNDGADTLKGDVGADDISGGPGGDVNLEGGEGDDTIDGDAGGDSIFGLAGGDVIDGGIDNDPMLDGGEGLDTVLGGAGNDQVQGGAGNDPNLDGGPGNDTVQGGQGNDAVRGGEGDDAIDGGTENDDLLPGAGDDGVVEGGDGTDTVSYVDGRTAGVIVDLSTAGADGTAAIDGAESLSNVENVTGTSFDDQITGSDGTNQLAGGEGNDVLAGLGAGDGLLGGGGNDTLTGDAGADSLDGEAGNDTLDGGAEDDAVVGAAGSDTLRGGSGTDTLFAGADADDLDGGVGNDVIDGGEGSDIARYSERSIGVSVTLNGLADDGSADDSSPADAPGDNVVGVETVIGGSGGDTLTGSVLPETLIGGAGADTVAGGDGPGDATSYAAHPDGVAVTLSATAGDDGSAFDGPAGARDTIDGIEKLTGSAQADTLVGGTAAEELSGAAGDDILRGGLGSDLLSGGDGVDAATYSERAEAVTVALDGAAGDGAAGENDTIAGDVENVRGGEGGDTLTGSAGDNVITGGAGDDTLEGLSGADVFDAGTGNDAIKAQDSVRDTGTCGDGTDSAAIDSIDEITACESTNLVKPVTDADRDGIEPPLDCNDGNAAIRPGAVEVPDNQVDENCDKVLGVSPPAPRITSPVTAFFDAKPKFTRVTSMNVTGIPAAATITITCKAPKKPRSAKRGCAFNSKTFRHPVATAKRNLLKLFKKRRIAPKTKIAVTITAPGSIGKRVTFTIRAGKRPLIRLTCLAPGSTRTVTC